MLYYAILLFSWVDRRYRKLRPVKPRFRKMALKTGPITRDQRRRGEWADQSPLGDYTLLITLKGRHFASLRKPYRIGIRFMKRSRTISAAGGSRLLRPIRTYPSSRKMRTSPLTPGDPPG